MNKIFMGLVLQALGLIIILQREHNGRRTDPETHVLIARWEEHTRRFTEENL